MTPKEKAKELVKKYGNLAYDPNESLFMNNEVAKSCAKIAVWQVQEELQSYSDLNSYIFMGGEPTSVVERLIYFSEVEDEIDEL